MQLNIVCTQLVDKALGNTPSNYRDTMYFSHQIDLYDTKVFNEFNVDYYKAVTKYLTELQNRSIYAYVVDTKSYPDVVVISIID